MVLVPIRAPLLSLCITIVSVISELAFLTAALSFLRFRACRRLRLHKRVRVRSQHRLVLAVTLFAMLAFVSVETVTSVFSDPQRRQTTVVQPCVRNILGVKNEEFPIEAEAIHFACTKIQNKTLTHFSGNFSFIAGQTACDSNPLYSYIIGKSLTLPVEGSFRSCEFRTCAFVTRNDNNDTVFISGPQTPDSQSITYVPTIFDPDDVKLLNLSVIAKSVAKIYADSITEEGEVRRRAFLGSIRTNCSFVRDNGPATTIPLGVLFAAGAVWILSLLFFFTSLFFRKKIFFDITHPMHWARRARHDLARAEGDDPELEMIKVNGQMRITVTGFMPDREDD